MMNNSSDFDYSLEFVRGTRNRFNKSQHICLHTSRSRWKTLQLHWCWSPRKTWRKTIDDFHSLDNILWAFVRHLLSVRKLWDLFAARWRKSNEALRLELGGTSRDIRDDKANYATCVQLELNKFKHRLQQLFRIRHFSLAHLSVVSQNLSFAHSWTSTKISNGWLTWPILVAHESSSINSTSNHQTWWRWSDPQLSQSLKNDSSSVELDTWLSASTNIIEPRLNDNNGETQRFLSNLLIQLTAQPGDDDIPLPMICDFSTTTCLPEKLEL